LDHPFSSGSFDASRSSSRRDESSSEKRDGDGERESEVYRLGRRVASLESSESELELEEYRLRLLPPRLESACTTKTRLSLTRPPIEIPAPSSVPFPVSWPAPGVLLLRRTRAGPGEIVGLSTPRSRWEAVGSLIQPYRIARCRGLSLPARARRRGRGRSTWIDQRSLPVQLGSV
jgi:hypothetical protein